VAKKPKPVEREKKRFSDLSEIQDYPYDSDGPRGYKKFYCDQEITIGAALDKIGMTIDALGRFNFGDDLEGYGFKDFEEGFVFFGTTYLLWQKAADFAGEAFEGFDGLTGEGGSWFWVPGDQALKEEPDPDGAYFDEYENPFEERQEERAKKDREQLRAVPPLTSGREYLAARSEPGGVWASCTVDTGIEPGDILLSHHQCDDFIAKLTLSWPTHAGIALNERWAVDADNRGDENAVDYITLMHFFAQKRRPSDLKWPSDNHLTPHGGLVYRYVGKPGDDRAAVEQIRHQAAQWAKDQTGNQYVFSLKSSHIIGKKKGLARFSRSTKIVEKDFDKQGKAVDEKGMRATRYSRSQKKYEETEHHSIYCAELVWRAYRKAGVNIVDPKKLANLFEDSSHGIAAVLGWHLRNEDWSFDDIDSKADDLQEKRDKELQDLKGRTKKEKVKGMGPVLQKSLIRECLRNARGAMSLVPAAIARKILIAIINRKFSAHFCAPYQLAQSELTERVAQLSFIGLPFDTVKVTDFRGRGIHPYKVLKAVSEGENAWKDFEDKKGRKLELRLETPWRDAEEQPDAPELKLDSDKDDVFYNTEVTFKGPQTKPPFSA